MEKEDQIIEMLQEMNQTLNEHTQILNEHSQLLHEHSQILNDHSQILHEHSQLLNDHSQTLKGHSQSLQEHGQILTALRSGQEHLKAELDGMKVAGAKEFGAIKEEQNNMNTNIEVLRQDTWANKVDIQHIKNTMGIS